MPTPLQRSLCHEALQECFEDFYELDVPKASPLKQKRTQKVTQLLILCSLSRFSDPEKAVETSASACKFRLFSHISRTPESVI